MHMNASSPNQQLPSREQVFASSAGTAKRRPSGPNIDLAKMAWGGKWLLITGLALGLGAGYFHFLQTPAEFRSSARVQITESSSRNLPVEGLQGTGRGGSRSYGDEAEVMKSEHILKRAARLGELSMAPEFSGLSEEQIAGLLSGSKLFVGPSTDKTNSSIFRIQFDSTSPSTSQRVVQAVIDAYALHLQEQYRNIGQETLELIQTARSDVLEKISKLEDEFNQFKEESELIFRDGKITSIHRDNADRYLSQRQTLMIQKGKLSSVLEAARVAKNENRPTKAVLLALQDSAANRTDNLAEQISEREVRLIKESGQIRLSERMRQEKLLPLELELQTLRGTVAEGHPAMKVLIERIEVIDATIRQIAKSENELQDRIDKAREIADGKGEEIDAEGQLLERLRINAYALKQNLDSVNEEIRLVTQAYQSEMEKAKQEGAAEAKSTQFIREIARQQQLYDRIVARLDEVNLMSESGDLKVFPLDTAKLGYQFAPSMPKSLLMGGFLGCMLAAGLVFLREMSDRSYHSALDISEHLRLPVIGHIPVLKRYKQKDAGEANVLDPRMVTVHQGNGSKSEAFRAIRTALYFSNQASGDQVIQVTSPTPGDGKSTIAANLAVSIAQSGRSVLLIDADLRRPRVGDLFGMECEHGLAWAIDQMADRKTDEELDCGEAIHETMVPNLSIMMAGERPDNPAELLASTSFERLLSLLRGKFDMIILDSPPMLAVSDPSNIVRRVDGVVMVVRLRKNIKPSVAQATRMLETLEANVLGVVVNGVGSRQAGSYGRASDQEGYANSGLSYRYGYGYSYGPSSGQNTYSEYYDEGKGRTKGRGKKNRKKKMQASS